MIQEFHGLGVAMVTPFLPDGGVDHESLKRLTVHLIEGGVDYLVVLGTTGETVTLSIAEQIDVITTVMDVNAGRLPIVLGAGGNNTDAVATKMIAFAEQFQPNAFLSASPAYNRPTQAGIVAHYQALSKVTDVPIILYNVPGRTASNLLSGTTLKIARTCPTAIGIKEASGNLEQCMEITAGRPEGFFLISGDDLLTLPLLAAGFDGLISVIANALPEETAQLVRAGRAGDLTTLRTLHYRLMPLVQAIFAEGNPAGVKTVLDILGICRPGVRLPLLPASDALRERIKELLLVLKSVPDPAS
ncbi:MAG: 4-hydroxy-tetrahydrodipicolinate synthase [Bacteroidota bacterium]